MKILNTEQTRALDKYTIENEPVSSLDLMERASLAFVRWFCDQFVNTRPVSIFCGTGNNGGDGLAIARMLSERSYQVKVFIVAHSAGSSADFQSNLSRLQNHVTPSEIHSTTDIPECSREEICVDALLGSGLSRPVSGILAEVITVLNKAARKIVSVDIASGLYAAQPNEKTDVIIKPDYTVSFQLPKLAFMLPQNASFVGEWYVVDIGLSETFISASETPFFYTDQKTAESLIRHREKFSNKGTFGHALLIAGSYGKIGAAVLSARACLRSGVGLLTLHTPGCGYEIVQISVPEAMATVDPDQKYMTKLPELKSYSAIGIGPGIGQEESTVKVLEALLKQTKSPLIIDADALNILSANPKLLELLPENTILTPHPKEFQRLAGESKNEYERLESGREFAKRHKVVICLKGAHTAVILPDGRVFFNSTGNAGMATGGTGDVLTGILTGILAQGYSAENTAILGVYEHGLAGDRAAAITGQSALIASDIVSYLKW